jgi:hypothetical protein
MNDIEELLRRDRAAGVPEPADVRYTVAVINRRLGRTPTAQSHQSGCEWLPVVAALCLLAAAVAAVFWFAINPWWLLIIPLSLLTMTPILLAERSLNR